MSNPLVSFDEQAVEDELRELVGKTIEETIDAMLDEEADQLVGAGPYERTDERAAYRADHYERGFTKGNLYRTVQHCARRPYQNRLSENEAHRYYPSRPNTSPQVKHHFLLRKQVVTARHLGQTGKARGHHGAIMPAVDTLLELRAERRALRTGAD